MSQLRKNLNIQVQPKIYKLNELMKTQKRNYVQYFVSAKGIADESIQGTYQAQKK